MQDNPSTKVDTSVGTAVKTGFGMSIGVVIGIVVLILLLCGGCFFVISLLAAGASNSISTNLNKEPVLVGSGSSVSTATSSLQAPKVYKKGDIVSMDGVNIQVTEIKDYVSSNTYMKPKAGNRVLVIMVAEENISNEDKSYNPLNYTLKDKDGAEYERDYSDITPSFSSGTMQPTKKAKGYLAFTVPTRVINSQLELSYSPSLFSSSEVLWILE